MGDNEILQAILDSIYLDSSDYVYADNAQNMAEELILASSYVIELRKLLQDAFNQECGWDNMTLAYQPPTIRLNDVWKNKYAAEHIAIEQLDCSEIVKDIIRKKLEHNGWFSYDGYYYYIDQDTADEWIEYLNN